MKENISTAETPATVTGPTLQSGPQMPVPLQGPFELGLPGMFQIRNVPSGPCPPLHVGRPQRPLHVSWSGPRS